MPNLGFILTEMISDFNGGQHTMNIAETLAGQFSGWK